jgi:hypothetical protein
MDKCKKCNVELKQGEAFQMGYEVGKYCESCIKKHEYYMTEEELKKNGLI